MDGTAAPHPPDLTAAREQVLAGIAAHAQQPGRPAATASVPLRRLPPALEGKLAVRARAQAQGTAASSTVGRVAVPCAVFAVADLVGVLVAAAKGQVLLAVFAGVLFVAFASIAAVAVRFAARDPLRLRAGERRAAAAASRWTSTRSWAGPLADCPERGLVIVAAGAAERIAVSPGYQLGYVDHQRIDLGAELDEIDEQAHRVAAARQANAGGSTDTAVEQAWTSAVDRVAALTAYADRLAGS